mmetsp:Transcript_60260/g.152528  ORF Transcript_60260/g.152528 Transcript_60260/m.152528 type:complete len:287 (-) Transcript_60260:41-901(-)
MPLARNMLTQSSGLLLAILRQLVVTKSLLNEALTDLCSQPHATVDDGEGLRRVSEQSLRILNRVQTPVPLRLRVPNEEDDLRSSRQLRPRLLLISLVVCLFFGLTISLVFRFAIGLILLLPVPGPVVSFFRCLAVGLLLCCAVGLLLLRGNAICFFLGLAIGLLLCFAICLLAIGTASAASPAARAAVKACPLLRPSGGGAPLLRHPHRGPTCGRHCGRHSGGSDGGGSDRRRGRRWRRNGAGRAGVMQRSLQCTFARPVIVAPAAPKPSKSGTSFAPHAPHDGSW